MSLKSLRRLYHINKTLCEYGIDELVPRSWWPWPVRLLRRVFFFWRNQHRDDSAGLRLRLAIEQLGPVFIKFGQMLSTRRDLLEPEIAQELALLQDSVPSFPGEQAKALIEQALGCSIEMHFDEFELTPLASASVAQVHSARLKDSGEEVVLKVIRPDIASVIELDVTLMQRMARLLACFSRDGRRLRPVEVVEEYRKTLIDELDLSREAANAMQLRRNFEQSSALYIPKVYSDYCRVNLMVMERIYGIPVSDIAALHAQNTDMKRLAERGVEVFFTQVFRDSFFHADMHPGNIFVSRSNPHDPQYIGIDCGIIGTLNKQDQRYLAEIFLGFFNRDYHRVAQLHIDCGWVKPSTKVEEFEAAIRTVSEPIFAKPLAEISFAHVLINLFNTARRFDMQVQPQLVLLQKTLLYVEGLGRQLYPQLDLWATAKPFLEQWMRQQVGFEAIWQNLKQAAPEWVEFMPQLPALVFDNLQQAQQSQRRFAQFSQQYIVIQGARQRSLLLTIASAAALLSGAIVYAEFPILACSLGGLSALGTWAAWRQLRQ